eukprot:3522329-Amphidinium_carterae.1
MVSLLLNLRNALKAQQLQPQSSSPAVQTPSPLQPVHAVSAPLIVDSMSKAVEFLLLRFDNVLPVHLL